MRINRKLLAKYNQPVPRYTSYPPANYFTEEFSASDYRQAIIESNNQQPENISFYIHIPFCNQLCFYCGCNSTPMAEDKIIASYIAAVKKEISMVLPLLDKNRKVSQIHYGGGTPNSVPVHYLQEINDLLLQDFMAIDNIEIAIECHPAYLDEAYIKALHAAGFNRFSLGIQDFRDDVLEKVNRKPSRLLISELMQLIKIKNNSTINLDFIYGLPGQTTQTFSETIDKAILLKPDRLVTFSYAHVPWVNKAQKVLEKKGLPDSNDKISMFETAYNKLNKKGYASIGMDHYVLKSDDLYLAQKAGQLHRNFQGYCTRKTTGQVYAFGVSGISQLENAYVQNAKSIDEFINIINSGEFAISKGYKLTAKEIAIRKVITQLMCNKYLKHSELPVDYNIDVLSDFTQDKLIRHKGDTFEVSEEGMLFIRNIAATFDPLMKLNKNTFSKSV